MDKTILKIFAIESRRDLIEKIDRKIKLFYINESFEKDNRGDVIVLSNDKHSLTLTKEEDSNRDKLIKRITELGYEQVLEEAAYTWFNRIVAIRYMEIHDYLPLTVDNRSIGIRVLSAKDNSINPEILKISNLLNPELDINFSKDIYGTLSNDDSKFKYVLLLICKKLGRVIPQVFDGITDYIDLLIPDNMLNENGFVNKLIKELPPTCFDEVEIIGWLYQYYISEKKDEVFSNLKKNIKLNKNTIPAATQLFTPDWIVSYMVQNTLGNYYEDKKTLEFYIENHTVVPKEIENITFFDPCCGSGHILVSAFELFYTIYVSLGYKKTDIPKLILERNIYGLDIDDRAGQLTILSLFLKARKYDSNIFNKYPKTNIYSIKDTNNISLDFLNEVIDDYKMTDIKKVVNCFIDAKEYGSIIKVPDIDYNKIEETIESIKNENLFTSIFANEIKPVIKIAKILSQKYDIVVTNPPYMGAKGMSDKLAEYTKKNFNDSKSDMFAVFIEKCRFFTKENGFYALITQPSFLFLSSFENLRNKIINEQNIHSLLHMGRGIFGIDFGSTSFVIQNTHDEEFEGDYYRLHQRTFQYIDVNDIKKIFLQSKNNLHFEYDFSKYKSSEIQEDVSTLEEQEELGMLKVHYKVKQKQFKLIPGMPLSFWLDDNIYKSFESKTLSEYGDAKFGMSSGDGEKYIRNWYEVEFNKISMDIKQPEDYIKNGKKWNVLDKGGPYRKWYGNKTSIVLWENDGREIRNNKKAAVRSPQYFFKPHISWPLISSVGFNARLFNEGYILDTASNCLYYNSDEEKYYLLGFLNSNVCNEYLKILNPTMNFSCGVVEKLPIIYNHSDEINSLVKENIEISKTDWDSSEVSWEFKRHPLLENNNLSITLEQRVKDYYEVCKNRFEKIANNEKELNNKFINIYNLTNTINSNVNNKLISINVPSEELQIKSLISYSIGCIFGRYSLDEDGLIYTGGTFDKSRYKEFKPDDDNIIPISDDDSIYYNDDLVGKFKEFIKISFGEENLIKNLDYIAEKLGKRGTESSDDTIRRYFVNDFYSDHIKLYQKKPIYWLFDSGKKNGFKCLIYLHRYNEQIVSKIRTKYLHNTLSIYQRTVDEIDYKLNNDSLSTTDKRELQNKKADLNGKITECNEYEEKVGNVANKMIKLDLDDGVVNNYSKFVDDNNKSILAKLK